MKQETGAPAALRKDKGAPANALLLEAHAADAESEVMRIKGDIAKLVEKIPQLDGADELLRKANNELLALRENLNDAYELWFKLSRQVREYDKAVSEQRRDGEKILRTEVERLLTQSWRFQRIGREAFVIGIAQEAMHCIDEKDFYARYAELIRGCESDSIKAGIENDKFPKWVLGCYDSSL